LYGKSDDGARAPCAERGKCIEKVDDTVTASRRRIGSCLRQASPWRSRPSGWQPVLADAAARWCGWSLVRLLAGAVVAMAAAAAAAAFSFKLSSCAAVSAEAAAAANFELNLSSSQFSLRRCAWRMKLSSRATSVA
jgi:hypothetical protein